MADGEAGGGGMTASGKGFLWGVMKCPKIDAVLLINKGVLGTSLMVQWLGLYLPTREVRVQSLVEELRSDIPRGRKTKTYNRNNTVTDSIKTLKNWSTSKNKNTTKPKRVLLGFL